MKKEEKASNAVAVNPFCILKKFKLLQPRGLTMCELKVR